MSQLSYFNEDYDLSQKSPPIVILPHQNRWRDEFEALAKQIRSIVSEQALRIDHIGSTSVTGLAAKDIVDIQITVKDLDGLEKLQLRLQGHGLVFRSDIRSDNFVGCSDSDSREWGKAYFREPEGQRRTYIHVREVGRKNQRYALLKMRLAEVFPECIDGYLFIKDPVMDIIFEAGAFWAHQTQWTPDNNYF